MGDYTESKSIPNAVTVHPFGSAAAAAAAVVALVVLVVVAVVAALHFERTPLHLCRNSVAVFHFAFRREINMFCI